MFLLLLALFSKIRSQDISAVELFPQTNTIQAETNYELKMLLKIPMPMNTQILIDFTNTDIVVPNGALSTCIKIDVFNTNNQVTYTQCSCSNKICTIIIPTQIDSGSFFLIRIGTLTNPDFVKAQIVQLSVNFGTSVSTASANVDVYSAGQFTLNSVSQSSFKVSALNDLGISLNTQHTIPNNGLLLIAFPTQIGFTNIQVKCDNGVTNSTGIITYYTSSVLVKDLFQSQINPNTQLIIYIIGTQNQESVRNSNSISLQSATKDSYLIDSMGISISTTIPEDITINTVTTTDTSIINSIATFQFNLSPALKFITGGYLQITFPQQLTVTSNMKCTRILGLTTVTGNTYSCSNDGQIVKTINLQYPNLNNALILIISAIKNPGSIKPTNKFEFRTFDLDGYLICVASATITFTASVDTLLQASFQRITATVGMESKYQLTVQNKNLIPSNGMYYISLGNQATKSTTTTLICNTGTTSLTCQYIDNQSIQIIVNSIEMNTILVIELNPLLNPNYVITDLSTLSVWSTDSEGYGIDKLSNININTLTPIAMLQIAFWRDSTITSKVDVGSVANIKIQFNVPSQYIIDNDGHLIIDLKGYYWRKQSESIVCQQIIDSVTTTKTCSILSYVSQVGFSMQLIQQLQIQNICQNHQSSITILISGLRNTLQSGIQNQIIEIQVTTINSQLVSKGQSDLTLGTTQYENSQISKDFQITADSPITGISTQYTLLIDLNTPLDIVDRNSYMEILIPTQIVLSQDANCISLINQQTLSCVVVDSKIKITSNLDPFAIVDKQLNVKIASLRNPYSTSITDNFVINQYYSSNICVQYKQTYQATQARDISVIIQRLPSQAGQEVKLQYSLKLDNAVDSLSIIIILPNDQVQNIGQLIVLKNNAQLATQITSNPDTTKIQFIESSCPCTINTQLIYQISNVQNPITTKQLSSVSSIQLLNNQAKLYQQNMSIVIPKCSVGTISLSQLSQTASALYQDTSITIIIDASTPISSGIIIIQFINITPYINQPTITINQNIVACTIDTKQIACNNINILTQNLIVLSNIKTIKWLTASDNCQFKISTQSQDNDQIDVSETLDCSKLIQLPVSQFTSTLIRNNRLLSSTTDLTISFNQEVNVYLQIAVPLSEVRLDALFHSSPQPTTTQDSSNTYFNFVLTTNIQTIIIYQLQNADSIPNSSQQYTIKLSNDGITTSYQSVGTISPKLQCIGTQCSGNPLLITNYTHNTLLIGQKTDITLSIQLPFQLKEMTELLLNSTQLTFPESRNCFINDTLLTDCQYTQCNSCDQTILIYQVKNAVNLDEYNSNERVCVSVLSIYESISICNTFTHKYNYLLDIRDFIWNQAYIYTTNAMVQFFIKPTSKFSASIATYLQFQQQGDFTNAKAYFNDSQTILTIQNNNVNIQICQSSCEAQVWYQIRMEQIIFSETTNQDTIFNIMRSAQILDTSIVVSFYPKLNPNQLELISITAIDFVQLKYNITSSVDWKADASIIFTFINNCKLTDTSVKYQINSTCNLKSTQLLEIQILHNNIVTHILQQNIPIVAQLQQCPIPLLEYKEECLESCPIKTYSQESNNQCLDCIQNNCQKCNQDQCLECNSNFEIVDTQCQLICNLNNCNQCQLIDNQIQCTSCNSPYELYQGSCYNSTDCYIDNCDNCLISNQQFQCTKCSPEFYHFQLFCVSQCENGYFPNEDQCSQCVTGCQKCSSLQQCEECQSLYKLDSGICVCNVQNCDKCSKEDSCDQCQDKFISYENQCVSQCPIGFYLDSSKNSCAQCQQQECTQCDNNGCLVCMDGYILNGSTCLPKICTVNCEECEMECTKCSDSYELINGECIQLKYSPYFGEISISYISMIIIGLGYMTVSLILPPSIPIIPQIIICSIIVFTTIQTLSGLLILLYFLINGLKLEFILISISFCSTTIINSLTSIINPNPLTSFLSGGTWFRIGLSKLRLIKKQKTIMSDYLVMRYQKQKIYFIGTGISILIDIVLVALQSQNNESSYLGSIRIVLDIILMVAFYLEHRLI